MLLPSQEWFFSLYIYCSWGSLGLLTDFWLHEKSQAERTGLKAFFLQPALVSSTFQFIHLGWGWWWDAPTHLPASAEHPEWVVCKQLVRGQQSQHFSLIGKYISVLTSDCQKLNYSVWWAKLLALMWVTDWNWENLTFRMEVHRERNWEGQCGFLLASSHSLFLSR